MVDESVSELNNILEQIERSTVQMREDGRPDVTTFNKLNDTLKEKFYTQLSTAIAFSHIMVNTQSVHVRTQAALGLKKVVQQNWQSEQSLAVKDQVKAKLLELLIQVPDRKLKEYVAEAISIIAAQECGAGKWPEFMNQIGSMAQSSDPVQREMAMFTLNEMFTDPMLFIKEMEAQEDLAPLVPHVLEAAAQALSDPDNERTRAIAVQIIGAIVRRAESGDAALKSAYEAVLPATLAEVQRTVQGGDVALSSKVLDSLTSILCLSTSSFDAHFTSALEFLVKVAAEPHFDRAIRNNAFFTLMKLPECCKSKLLKLNLVEPIIKKILPVCAEQSSEDGQEDEEDDDDMSLDNLKPSTSALDLINTYAVELPPKHIFLPLMEAIHPWMTNQDPNSWRWRKACMEVIQRLTEGTMEKMRKYFKEVLEMIVAGLRDSNRIVRKSACDALALIAQYLDEETRAEHKQIMPILFDLLGDVESEALSAMESVFDALTDKEAVTYMTHSMDILTQILQRTSENSVKTSALKVLCSLVTATRAEFVQYTDSTMQLLQGFIHVDPKTPAEIMVVSNAALDCITGICEAVGAENFKPYAPTVLELAMKTVQLGDEEADARKSAFSLFAVLASLYPDEITPYLETIVKEIIKAGSSSDWEDHTSADVALDNDEDDDDDWGEEFLRARMRIAAEKEFAIEVLSDLFAVLEIKFLPYVESSFEMIKSLAYHAEEIVRAAAASGMFNFLRIAYDVSQNQKSQKPKDSKETEFFNEKGWTQGLPVSYDVDGTIKTMTKVVMDQALDVLGEEDDAMVAEKYFDDFGVTCNKIGPLLVADEKQLKLITDYVLATIESRATWQKSIDEDRNETVPAKKPNPDDLKELTEAESKLLQSAIHLLSYLAECLGENFKSIAPMVVEPLMKYYRTTEEPADKGVVLGCLGEMFAAIGKYAVPYIEVCHPEAIAALSSKADSLPSQAVYAVGVMASLYDLSSHYPTILAGLSPLFHVDYENTIDNACGAASRLILSRPDLVPIDEVLDVMLSKLPLKNDYLENAPVLECLCKLLVAKHEYAIKSVPRIIEIFVYYLQHKDEITRSSYRLIIQTLGVISGTGQPEIRKIIQEQVPAEQQQVIMTELASATTGGSSSH